VLTGEGGIGLLLAKPELLHLLQDGGVNFTDGIRLGKEEKKR